MVRAQAARDFAHRGRAAVRPSAGISHLLVAALVALAPAALAAQEPAHLDALIAEALRANPEVLAAQAAYEAAQQRPSQAGALPDPMVSLSYNSVGSPRPFAGIGEDPVANAGGMISQTIPFPGKRGLRRNIAGREAEVARQEYEAARLRVTSAVKEAYHRLAQAYTAGEILDRNRDLLRRFLRISESRYSAGSAAQQDIFKTQTQISIVETRRERLKQEIRSREAELLALLGRRGGEPIGRPSEIESGPLRVSLEQLLAAAAEAAPALARGQRAIQRSELSVQLARRELYPDFTVSGGVYTMGSMGQMYMARLDFTLPLWAGRKQRAGIAEQSAMLRQARREYDVAELDLAAKLKAEYAAAETAGRLAGIYNDTVLPQSRLALESSLPSYQTGAVDLLTVLTNLMTVLEYEMNQTEERLNYELAVARIEGMTGIDPTHGLSPRPTGLSGAGKEAR